ncbi:cytochrome c [Variovorax sp. J22R115]|uniref:c-type cytochrome n=1 Tax=Variovorax sp. J22R115 TaxID=3053509 RepID=UPI0025774E0D|nr:cytochrome c [Variovorax sp. J22R115]MDM0051474.1 cytochrome c [Variovorax sp. J22R115]
MKRVILITLAAACAAISAPAAAQFAKTEDAIKYRQSAMFIQGQHVGRLGAMAAGRVPYDAVVAVSNAEVVAQISRLPWAGFGPGTEGGKAKPEIWKEQAKFKELSERLMGDTDKLLVAAKAGNLDALKTAMGAVGETCKTCHDTFRNK